MMLVKFKLLIIGLLLFAGLSAQNRKAADDLYDKENYSAALEIYLQLLNEKPDDYHLNFRTGVCQLKTSVVKSKSIPYLTKAASFANEDPIAYYLLGRAYQYSYQFDPAIRAYEKFIQLSDKQEDNVRYAKKKIEYCYNAKEFMKFPMDLTFENLGDNINSKFPDYFPFVTAGESFIIFNSKRNDGSKQLQDGTFSSNIYVSQVKDGKYQKAFKLEGIGADTLNEKVIGLSAGGERILYTIEKKDGFDMYLADFLDFKISNSELLTFSSDEKLGNDVTASITSDGRMIYFATELENTLGGTDIYVARLLPNKKWSKLQNLGPKINTDWDEQFPNIADDDKTLYFSSEGHAGLGGMDIYRTVWNEDSAGWTTVKNMGYPLNTPDDDMNFRKATAAKYGYLSVNREDGFGDLDVYRVKFGEEEPSYSIVTGNLYSINKTQLKDDIFISVIDQTRDRVYGEYLPNTRTGRYVMALPPGNYRLLVEVEGFKTIDQPIEILDKSSYQSYIYQDMVLKPEGILMALPGIE